MKHFLGMMTVIEYLYIHRIIQMFGGGNRKSGRIKGLYMYGSVGAGKTMLMDLFYKRAAVARKRRVHFNSFMLDIHDRIHQFKKALPRSSGRERPHAYDPIAPVARDVASDSHLLCFDEFQVTYSDRHR
jgi:protein AFG1